MGGANASTTAVPGIARLLVAIALILLVASLPTMLTGFVRYSQDNSFAVLRRNRTLVILMAAGSIGDAFIGGQSTVTA
ncbi:hypothetical protein AAHK20_04050 [Trinickia sp. YCB016]